MKANLVIAEDNGGTLHFVHAVGGELVTIPCPSDADGALQVFDRVMNGEGGFHRAALFRRPQPHRERNCAVVEDGSSPEKLLEEKGKKKGYSKK